MNVPPSASPRPLAGKTALITGSTSGIGAGIARALAAGGANVVLNGFGDAAEIELLRAGLVEEHGVRVAYDPADMTQPAAIAAMVERAGAVDILVNNAGIQFVSPVEDFPVEKWDAILAINLSSAFHTIRAALLGMRARGWGRIVNVASAHGLVASPHKSAYVAAKHGLVGLTKSVALEAALAGITCNAICPGFVLTPLVEKQIEDLMRTQRLSREAVAKDLILAKQPTKQFVQIEEVAALTVFLCSEAAASITGAALSIDGGWSAA